MRVVAGSAKGRRLVVPKGTDIRPTSDRVRESLFSILGSVEGSIVFDLYCGSGALAVEALSRGAGHATLVDRLAPAATAARENLGRAGVADRATVIRARVEEWAARCGETGADLVFLDPPYAASLDSQSEVVSRLVERGCLTPGALVVLERSTEGEEPVAVGPLPVVDVRRYGDTRLVFARSAAPR